jgi:outer membrane protein assembly factor BamE (lipoprotein component of BamABCDE complex)
VAPGKEGWRKLQKGMTESEVEQLLGSPSKGNMFSSFSVWHYGVAGSVQFDDDKRVTGWSEP